MSFLQGSMAWVISITYIALVITMLGLMPFSIYLYLQDRKNKKQIESDINEKLAADVVVDIDLLRQVARARGVTEGFVAQCIRRLLADSNDKERIGILKALASDFEKIEPYADLPAEPKASLIKLRGLLQSSPNLDVSVLEPIARDLTAYVELKSKTERNRKAMAVFNGFSLFIGILGAYLTLTAPTLLDVQAIVENAVSSAIGQPASLNTEKE